MYTPFDWQEGIGHRAQFVEGKLAQGLPVVAASIKEGILVVAFKRKARKVFEVYDRLIYAAIGQQSDVEALRVAAVEFAHREGYNRSEDDVNVERLVASLSQPVKKAFGDFSLAPLVARCLFAEVADNQQDDCFMVLDYDGDYRVAEGFVVLAGDDQATEKIQKAAEGHDWQAMSAADAAEKLTQLWLPEEGDPDMTTEAVLMVRDSESDRRFRPL